MDIVYQSVDSGQRLYAVRAYGADLFLGTREQCDRFLTIHKRKVLDERASDLAPRRHSSIRVRTYRVACRAGV